jgi:hypothetical protein
MPRESNEIKPSQLIMKAIFEYVPSPLGYALIIGGFLLSLVVVGIGLAYPDFDLRLKITSFWFFLALSIACFAWLIAVVLTFKKLSRMWRTLCVVLFLVGMVFSVWRVVKTARYRYNDLGFYEPRSWHRAERGGLVWPIEGIKGTLPTLHVEMHRDAQCNFDRFHPVKARTKGSEDANSWKSTGDVDLQSGREIWDIENFVRGGVVIFRLDPAGGTLRPSDCAPPIVSGSSSK